MKAWKASALVVAVVAGSIAIAQNAKEPKPGGHEAPAMQLPPGWTPEDMQACMAAGAVNEHHAWLAKGAGTWIGKEEMWMGPGTPGMKSECVSTITTIMGGRYAQVDNKGEVPGFGEFHGMGTLGYDNVVGKYVATWIDNMGTGIMTGSGDVSKDGKTLTLNYTYNCPIAKKPMAMREVQTRTSDTTMTLEMFANDPKSGKEYKMLHIDFTKKN